MMFTVNGLPILKHRYHIQLFCLDCLRYLGLFLLCGTLLYSTLRIFTLYHAERQAQQKIATLRNQTLTLTASLSEETALNKTLNQRLSEQTAAVSQLHQRISDMENVFGLSTNVQQPELKESVDNAALNSALTATIFQLIPNGAPTPNAPLTSGFGVRVHPITKQRKHHEGLDFGTQMGTPIYAPADAVIAHVQHSRAGYGNQLTLTHTLGFVTTYSHMSKFNVKEKQFVTKGDLIGWTGNSGLSTGPHLHYEIHFLGKPLNPRPFVLWDEKNIESIFDKEKNVQWSSLIDTLTHRIDQQLQLALKQRKAVLETGNKTQLTQDASTGLPAQ